MMWRWQKHRLPTLVALLSSAIVSWGLTLGGRVAHCDSATGTWLCSVPRSLFGHDWTTTVAVDTAQHWIDVSINGRALWGDEPITFANIDAGSSYSITALDTVTHQLVKGNICFTYLPILSLQGDFNNQYQVSTVTMSWPDNVSSQPMLARIKHRGATTNMPGRHKRNYHLKFINPDSSKMDRTFFGLRNDNSWLLDAGQVDLLRIRNRVATELWLDMCRKPYYADREPQALLGVRGDYIEVFLNGKYQGFYALTEAMDRKQLKLAKYDEKNHTQHGMLWKTKQATDVALMRRYQDYDNNQPTWQGIEVKYPDPDDVMPTDYEPLAHAIKFVMNSSPQEFIDHACEYFDLPVIMDYWIMINTLLAVDNGAKNIYWMTYDQATDIRLKLAAWDLDCTVGQNWINTPPHNSDIVGPERQLNFFNNLLLRLHERNPDNYCIKTVERYRQLRQGILSTDSIYQRYHNRIEWLKGCGALDRETRRWSGDSDLSGCQLDFDAELAYVRQWLDIHLNKLDNTRFRPYVHGDINRDGNVDIGDINSLINKILHQDRPTWYEDLSHDFTYDIADINLLINIMLYRNI